MPQPLYSAERWGDFLMNTPCVKTAYLSAVGIAALMFAHKMRIYNRGLRHALSASFLTFTMTSGASFYICSTDRYNKQQVVKKSLQKNDVEKPPINLKK